MMMKLLIATTNQGKKRGMQDGFKGLKSLRLLSLKDFPKIKDTEETGSTFAENALQKAKYYGEAFLVPTIGEDSGILVEAFPEKFGIKTRREFGDNVSDMEWIEKFLELMKDQKKRSATFVSTMVFYDPHEKKQQTVEGRISGHLAEFPQTPIQKGVPASSIFIPNGASVVHGALSTKEKKKYSHRGIACQRMSVFLAQEIKKRK